MYVLFNAFLSVFGYFFRLRSLRNLFYKKEDLVNEKGLKKTKTTVRWFSGADFHSDIGVNYRRLPVAGLAVKPGDD